MQQHHDMETYFPVDPSKLSYNDKMEAVEAMVTDQGKTMWSWGHATNSPNYKKEDVCSPTVYNDCVMITSAIYAHERRDFMAIDC